MAKAIDPDEMKVYGARLRAARTAADVTQREVGKVIGCTQPYLSRVENGEMLLRPIDYPPVAALLGVAILIGPLTEEERERIDAVKRGRAEERNQAGYSAPGE